jgi:hypothetical protein
MFVVTVFTFIANGSSPSISDLIMERFRAFLWEFEVAASRILTAYYAENQFKLLDYAIDSTQEMFFISSAVVLILFLLWRYDDNFDSNELMLVFILRYGSYTALGYVTAKFIIIGSIFLFHEALVTMMKIGLLLNEIARNLP